MLKPMLELMLDVMPEGVPEVKQAGRRVQPSTGPNRNRSQKDQVMASNVIPFQRRSASAGYAPGVVPFDNSNPAHVQAWNVMFQLGCSELRFKEMERHDQGASLECVQ